MYLVKNSYTWVFTAALCLYVYLSSRKQKNVRAGISHLLKLSRSWLSLSYWLFFCLFPFKNDLMRKWALKLLLGTKKVRLRTTVHIVEICQDVFRFAKTCSCRPVITYENPDQFLRNWPILSHNLLLFGIHP